MALHVFSFSIVYIIGKLKTSNPKHFVPNI